MEITDLAVGMRVRYSDRDNLPILGIAGEWGTVREINDLQVWVEMDDPAKGSNPIEAGADILHANMWWSTAGQFDMAMIRCLAVGLSMTELEAWLAEQP